MLVLLTLFFVFFFQVSIYTIAALDRESDDLLSINNSSVYRLQLLISDSADPPHTSTSTVSV